MNRWKGKVAIVTGASAGIGLAIAKHLVDCGLIVIGLARRKEKLEKIEQEIVGKKGKFYGIKADVSKESEILEAFQSITKRIGIVHILINNAGIGRPKGLLDGTTKHWEEILDTNLLGLCIATREAIKIMRANNVDGHVIHISSIAGHSVPNFPNLNVYPATKHGVRALTETLRHELNAINSKIKVSSISPGYVESEFMDASGLLIPSQEGIAVPILMSEDIAQAVLYVLGTPAHVQVQDLIIKPVGERF